MSLDSINTQIKRIRDYIGGFEYLALESEDLDAEEVVPFHDPLLDEAQILLGRACEALECLYKKKEYHTVDVYVRMQGYSFLNSALYRIAEKCEEISAAQNKLAIMVGECDEYQKWLFQYDVIRDALNLFLQESKINKTPFD